MDKIILPKLLSTSIGRQRYNKNQELYLNRTDNLHWGQRKLLLSEINFLTTYYSYFDNTSDKIVLYIGSADGFHINYLMDMFQDLKFILFDKRKTYVNRKNAEIYERYFTEDDAKKYVNKNVFMICDIRNLSVAEYKENIRELDKLIMKDMEMQQYWYELIKPKKALIKFRLPYTIPSVKYLDGEIYFQLWAKNASTETRLVPNGKMKVYDTKVYEEQMFYFNNKIRRATYRNVDYPCIGRNYDCMMEAQVLTEYILKFKPNVNVKKLVCDISLSITLYLSKYGRNPINEKYLKK